MTTPEQDAVAAITVEADRAAERGGTRVSLDAIWDALATVPDPEIPVVSVVELGIVRAVAWTATGARGARDAHLLRVPSDRPHHGRHPRGARGGGDRRRQGDDRALAGVDHRLDRPGSTAEARRVRHRAARAGGIAPSTSRASVRCAARATRWPARAAGRHRPRSSRSSARPRARRCTAARRAASPSTTSSRTDPPVRPGVPAMTP